MLFLQLCCKSRPHPIFCLSPPLSARAVQAFTMWADRCNALPLSCAASGQIVFRIWADSVAHLGRSGLLYHAVALRPTTQQCARTAYIRPFGRTRRASSQALLGLVTLVTIGTISRALRVRSRHLGLIDGDIALRLGLWLRLAGRRAYLPLRLGLGISGGSVGRSVALGGLRSEGVGSYCGEGVGRGSGFGSRLLLTTTSGEGEGSDRQKGKNRFSHTV